MRVPYFTLTLLSYFGALMFGVLLFAAPLSGVAEAQWNRPPYSQQLQPPQAPPQQPPAQSKQPHPAVCRISVPERGGVAYGSGTLIAVQDKYGLVITNWHVVGEANDVITVHFPNGFQSGARVLKTDRDWDLAALLIWRPEATPVTIARDAPQRGESLTIAGYGQGQYREVTGRCTQYVSPGMHLPFEMVELSAEARQGDSGGPIFNQQGELAGVLFGASRGTTAGSYAGRVGNFLAPFGPRSPGHDGEMIAQAPPKNPAPIRRLPQSNRPPEPPAAPATEPIVHVQPTTPRPTAMAPIDSAQPIGTTEFTNTGAIAPSRLTWHDFVGRSSFDYFKTVLAAIGIMAIFVKVLRWLD